MCKVKFQGGAPAPVEPVLLTPPAERMSTASGLLYLTATVIMVCIAIANNYVLTVKTLLLNWCYECLYVI